MQLRLTYTLPFLFHSGLGAEVISAGLFAPTSSADYYFSDDYILHDGAHTLGPENFAAMISANGSWLVYYQLGRIFVGPVSEDNLHIRGFPFNVIARNPDHLQIDMRAGFLLVDLELYSPLQAP